MSFVTRVIEMAEAMDNTQEASSLAAAWGFGEYVERSLYDRAEDIEAELDFDA